MNPILANVAQMTAHPGLYRKTYWGGFKLSETITPEIIANRNLFAKEYGLKSYFCPPRMIVPFGAEAKFDHAEGFHLKDGRVLLLLSGYGYPPPAALGMSQIYQVYSTETTSHVGIFESLSKLKAVLKEAEKVPLPEFKKVDIDAMLAGEDPESVSAILGECRFCHSTYWIHCRSTYTPGIPRIWRPMGEETVDYVLRDFLNYSKRDSVRIRRSLPELSKEIQDQDPMWEYAVTRHIREMGRTEQSETTDLHVRASNEPDR